MTNLIYSQVKEKEITSKNSRGKAELINFSETKINSDEKSVNQFLKKQFNSENEVDFKQNPSKILVENQLESKKFQQFYKGIKAEFGVQNVVSENGILKTVNGRYIDIQNLDIKPSLTENQALAYALKNINAKEYIWENKENETFLKKEQNNPQATYYPKGELIILEKDLFSDNPTPKLAYKFDIYAMQPLSRNNIYVDANNGEIIIKDAIIKHVDGTADTRYSGQRIIKTQLINAQYKLRDYSRGSGVETYNMNNGTNYNLATDFIDNDNNWTALEFNNSNKDNAALDAHWGAEKTYDYFLAKHNRNSFNNSGGVLKNYIHTNLIAFGYANNFNAFWDGQKMTYGDGFGNPLTTIDIIGHEIGHGVCSTSANLIYSNESGAINESLSDIWGAMIEFYAEPTKQTYLIGEDIGAIRSMSNPKTYNNPNTYGGQYWYTGSADNGGVHTNSGVLNHWFYILAEGKSGTNDIQNTYNVTGIGKEKAAKIVYRAETTYFTATTNYAQARDLTIQAAKDLYGTNSIESATVCQSWYAVGVGNNNCVAQVTLTGSNLICDTTLNYAYTVSNLVPGTSITWSVSSKLLIVSSSNSSLVVKPISTTTTGSATITANVSGIITTKTIWIGKPAAPKFIYGPSSVVTGALVNYSSSESLGATYYDWWLPYPYDTVTVFDYFAQNWQKLTNYSSTTTIQVFTGYAGTTGLVQVMGKNDCGCGPAKTMSVSHGSGGGGPGGGGIPVVGFANNNTKYIIYPNPSNDIIYIDLRNQSDAVNWVVFGELFDLQGISKTVVQIIDNKATVNVKNLPKGIYILKINIDGQVETHQIIVE
ncbi:M4 family metallopeptidase [Flavobacterium sp.]|uniref:M4 family metallopeptidase n=1 Tax=Flavobacterium sp. TaxID=239 RepID=UPI00286D76BA|nr:M4 family metallopeptidase [Flavobacterium sp.]